MKFEEKLAELEGVVKRIESGDVGLEEGIGLYEQSLGLTRECLAELNAFKGKLTVIKEEMDRLTETAFDEQA